MSATWVLAEPHESLLHAEVLEHSLRSAGTRPDWAALYAELPDTTTDELRTKTAVAILALRSAT